MIFLSARRKAWLALLGVLASCALVFFVNPSEHTLIPCYFNVLTGYKCAGCGLTRATHHIFHADWLTAFQFNPLVFVVLPLFGYGITRYIMNNAFNYQLPELPQNKTISFIAAVILILFMFLRNVNF